MQQALLLYVAMKNNESVFKTAKIIIVDYDIKEDDDIGVQEDGKDDK
jgi:hypothetical protein